MRIAVIGDVHANMPALTAVIEDVSRAGASATYCVGDIVGRGPHPNEVVEVMRRLDIPSVQGNWDEAVAMDRDSTGAAWDSLEAEAAGGASMRWTAEALSDENKAWLRQVPVRGRVVIDGRSVAFFHGSHVRQTEYLWSDRPSRFYSRLASEEGDDVFCFGHTHEAHHRVVGQAHLVACGSVGCPNPGEATATYALLDIGDGRVVVGFRAVEYDLAWVTRDMTALGLPHELLLEPPPRHALPLHVSLTA
ncbi:MAG TPA: metallophosphoesterase family protein [Candidatus Limnocylindria bacterium]